MDEWKLLERIKEEYQSILGRKLTGIYVHGSLAFGCFRWECSDIDFLAVVEDRLSQSEKEALIRALLTLDASAPARGFEMSVLLREACMPFADPVPFELHYSNAHRAPYQQDLSGTCRRMNGLDPDLPAHMTVVQTAGIVLCGPPVKDVFAPVPPHSYWQSLWEDIACAPQEIRRDPVYYVLNLCRAAAFAEEQLVLSKEQGGEWGLLRLPGYSGLIAAALAAYRGSGAAPAEISLSAFAETMLERIRAGAVFQASETEKY